MFAILSSACAKYDSSDPFQTLTAAQGEWKVRQNAFHEKSILSILPGAYYVFETFDPAADTGWREIMTIHHDDPWPIESDSVQIINDEIAFVYKTDRLAVTSDRGKTWTFWDETKTPELKDVMVFSIDAVNIKPDGYGEMIVRNTKEEGFRLSTSDTGITWKFVDKIEIKKAN